MGDEDINKSLTDLTGDESKVPLIVAAHAGDGEERGQEVLNGEAVGEPAGESVEVREPPTPMGLV